MTTPELSTVQGIYLDRVGVYSPNSAVAFSVQKPENAHEQSARGKSLMVQIAAHSIFGTLRLPFAYADYRSIAAQIMGNNNFTFETDVDGIATVIGNYAQRSGIRFPRLQRYTVSRRKETWEEEEQRLADEQQKLQSLAPNADIKTVEPDFGIVHITIGDEEYASKVRPENKSRPEVTNLDGLQNVFSLIDDIRQGYQYTPTGVMGGGVDRVNDHVYVWEFPQAYSSIVVAALNPS